MSINCSHRGCGGARAVVGFRMGWGLGGGALL